MAWFSWFNINVIKNTINPSPWMSNRRYELCRSKVEFSNTLKYFCEYARIRSPVGNTNITMNYDRLLWICLIWDENILKKRLQVITDCKILIIQTKIKNLSLSWDVTRFCYRNLNSMENSFHSHLVSNTVIATKFNTWHDNCAVESCTNICSIWWPAMELRRGEISIAFELRGRNRKWNGPQLGRIIKPTRLLLLKVSVFAPMH